MSLDEKVEKADARWDFIENNERDLRDFRILQKKIDDSTVYPENEPLPEIFGKGMLLRRGNEPIGYVLFDVDEYENKKILSIAMMYVLEKERNPIIMARLLHQLRTFALEQHVTHVHWTGGSDNIDKASKNVPSVGQGIFLVPIEQFNLDLFLGKL